MLRNGKVWTAVLATVLLGGVYLLTAGDDKPNGEKPAANAPDGRAELMKTFRDGNYKDAYVGLRKLALDPKCDPLKVSEDLNTGVQCLQNLGRVNEIDEFREAVIKVHGKNWRLLRTAAHSYINVYHYGFIIAGEFQRGPHRGGGRWANAQMRDRTRALQLMQQALPFAAKDEKHNEVGHFYLNFADMMLQGVGRHTPWRLQYRTDLSKLPDFNEGYFSRGQGAPVDEKGEPVFYHVPKSYADAGNDGERWRWLLVQAAETDKDRINDADGRFADFLYRQFGVQTMAGFLRGNDSRPTGTYALHTLKDSETIARLATGVKRLTLPDEFNFIKVYERISARGKSAWGERARDALASIYENRRQYVKAAKAWKDAIAEYGVGHNRQQRLEQIVNNWGRFEPARTMPARTQATVDYRFRNGTKVSFEAFEIKVPTLLADVKKLLESNPQKIQWQDLNISDIGQRLIWNNQQKYIGEKAAAWDVKLDPPAGHVDDRITIKTPMTTPGAYLLIGKMANGNVSRIVVWVSDTANVKKRLAGSELYFVADAVTGKPLPKAEIEYFGWWRRRIANTNRYETLIKKFKETTDKDGQVTIDQAKADNHYQWLIIARKNDGQSQRFAYLGFTHIWFGRQYDPEYNQTKVLLITDRPVYRPEHTVQWKFWVRHAKYDQADASSFANQNFTVRINNPKGEKVYEKQHTADEFGGLAGEFPLSRGCMLGQYSIYVLNKGGGSFRVEEYKKPEFEVNVEAPKEPVRLGDKVEATIKANYFFGAPVTSARVKYTVKRTSFSGDWFPHGEWDWFYGPGYWWFNPDARWYPGWSDWCGCMRPTPWWWHRSSPPPEIVLENEAAIGADGTVKFEIDTKLAKELHGDTDHKYTITAEVVDESRRTIVGMGDVLVSRKPFQVFTWLNRGHYRAGDTVKAYFNAHTLDNQPVEGKGKLTLFRITYKDNKPVEKSVETWEVDTNAEGKATQQLKAAQPGQYRLSYELTDNKKHTIEGGYLFVVRGEGADDSSYRFNDLELITDKREYAPGDKVQLLINTNRDDGVVLLFVKPTNGVYLAPKILRLDGKSTLQEIAVAQKDMPNFFIEAVTISNGEVHTETREIVVPPVKRVLNVAVLPDSKEYLPGQQAKVKVKLTDLDGKPFVGSTVMSVYDKSVEYISGGTNVPEIKEFFWKWRRHHSPQVETNLGRYFHNLLKQGETGMSNLGVFGANVVEELARNGDWRQGAGGGVDKELAADAAAEPRAPGAAAPEEKMKAEGDGKGGGRGAAPPGVEPAVRKNFADTAFWNAELTTNKEGVAEVAFKMPEQLTGWKIKVWAMGHGTRVGQGEALVVTKKNILVRLQAPRFFVQKDEVVLSANVHNYLPTAKDVTVSLELDGPVLYPLDKLVRTVRIPANGEHRIDWRVRVQVEGEAVVRMKAVTDEESDAMEMRFPSFVHGMLKMDSFSGVVRPDKDSASITMTVPAERRINATRLEVRYSPTLAGAMVDALPYLVDYPYGCTEQTLNRFVPTVITQNILMKMELDLKEIEKKRTNLNAQELGDAQQRAKGWKRYPRNPVFNIEDVKLMSAAGVQRLAGMQCSDGGWGWFSGHGEASYPHTTAVVVHGLQLARANKVTVPPNMITRGVQWLQNYQDQQILRLKNAPAKIHPWKEHADNIDAFVFMVLGDNDIVNEEMRDFLYRDRTHLAVYAKAMFGLALHKQQQGEKLAMILKNIEQYVVEDDENQTAYLKLPANNYWWYWYGSENEANAYYLKLLARTNPKDRKASRLVKYLLNNRKHGAYWNSTRDTAICIEAMAEYLSASGEDRPDMTIEVWLDGKKEKEVKVDSKNLFSFDNTFLRLGDALESGKHVVEIKRKGKGSIYFNAYLTNFTLEDFITRAGLEVKVNRKYYKLTRVDKKIKVSGSRGQALDQKIEKFERTELKNLAELKSGDLVEVELVIESKNDYEYLCFEDPKASGFEPMLVRSGYNPNDMGAYMELRDDKVCFFVRRLARGKHSLSYRLRAEIPGKFSALPTRAFAMYAPELKGNSDEIKLVIKD